MVVLDGDALFHARTLCDYSNHPAVMRRQEDYDKRRKKRAEISEAEIETFAEKAGEVCSL